MNLSRAFALPILAAATSALAGTVSPSDLSTWTFREIERWTVLGYSPSMAWAPDGAHLALRQAELGYVEVWARPDPRESLLGYFVEDRDHRPFLVEVTPFAEKTESQALPFWMSNAVLAATYWCTAGDTADACPQGGGIWTYDLRSRSRTQVLKRQGVTAAQRSTTGDLLLRFEDARWHIWSQDKDVGIANLDPADNLPAQADRQCSSTWSGHKVEMWDRVVMLKDERTHQARAVAQVKAPWIRDGAPVQPCWSPDGRFISYLEATGGRGPGKGGPMDAEEGQAVILAVNPQ